MMLRFFVGLSVLSITVTSKMVFAHGTIEELTVLGRDVNLIGEAISASQGKISQEELASRPILRAGEVLEVVPGMVATQHSGSGKANQYFLRGFNLDHGTDFATFIDAMPVNMRSHGHGQGYTDLNFIIPELIGEIDYKKGSYYADVGDFSGTGSAEIRSARALKSNQINIGIGIGENGFGRGLVIGDAKFESSNVIYGLEHQVYDGPWDDINEDVNKTNIWLKQILGDKDNQFTISFMGYDNKWNSADQIPERAVRQGLISELGSLDTTLGGESSRYSVSGTWRHKTRAGNFSAAVYAIRYDLDLWSNFTFFTSPEGDQFQQVDDRTIYGGNFSYQQLNYLFGKDVGNTVGIQTRFDDIDEVGLYSSSARQRTGVFRADAVKEHSTSLYWENTVQWDGHLRSVIGLRYDYYDFDVNPLAAADPSTLMLNSGTVNDGIFTGSLSLIYTFNNEYEAYASIGQGFHSNDARGVTIQADPNTGDPIAPADPLVETLGYEIGLRAFITKKLNASLVLWHLDIDSELLFIGDEGTTEDTGVSSSRDGLEMTAYYSFDDRWTLDVEYAYTNARFDQNVDGSNEIPSALESVVSAGLHTQFNAKFYSHLRLRYFGDYPLDGGERAASSALVNLRIGYRINAQFNVTLDALNMFNSNDRDIEYFYASQLATESAPVNDRHYHIFEPQAFRLYATFNY